MSTRVFALVDCNNFFASCERVFNPKLNNKPVVVLSNIDGCFVSRSNEAKALGIPMGAPFFEYRSLCETKGVHVFSSNYRLYGDMSNRVMSSLRCFSPDVEIYSVDEAFVRLDYQPSTDLVAFCSDIRAKIKQWTGIPVSIGIGQSKTLAKIANFYAKKNKLPVFDIRDKETQDYILGRLELEDIWGVGKRIALRLRAMGIFNAAHLRDANAKLIRKQFGVVGEKIVYELKGMSCLDLELTPKAKKNIVISRSFSKSLTKLQDLEEALTNYVAIAASKMRAQNSKLQGVCAFIITNKFLKNQIFYSNSASIYFDLATDNTMQIAKYAKKCLHKIFKPDLKYRRVGVMLLDLIDNSYNQGSLLSPEYNEEQSAKLMKTLDNINNKMGRDTVFLASQGCKREWQMRALRKSPNYIGDWNQLIQAN